MRTQLRCYGGGIAQTRCPLPSSLPIMTRAGSCSAWAQSAQVRYYLRPPRRLEVEQGSNDRFSLLCRQLDSPAVQLGGCTYCKSMKSEALASPRETLEVGTSMTSTSSWSMAVLYPGGDLPYWALCEAWRSSRATAMDSYNVRSSL